MLNKVDSTWLTIQWPAEWTSFTRNSRLILVIVLVFVASSAGGGLLLLDGAAPPVAVVSIFGIGVWFLPLLVMGFFLAFRLHRLGSFGSKLYKLVDSSVVVLRFSGTMRYCQLLFLALTAGVFLAMPIIDGSAPYEDSFSRVRLHQLALVLPYAAILPAATVFSRVFRKRGHLGVGLSLQGVYHWSWFGCCFYAWDWIKEVRAGTRGRAIVIQLVVDEPKGHGWNEEENFIARWKYFRQRKKLIPVQNLAVNPAVPYYALEFYRRHPELRHELGTQEGVERIRRGDLPDVIDEVREHGRFRVTMRSA